MANDLDALLKVKAQVSGKQDLREADGLLRRLGVTADNSAGGMRRMASAGNALQGALAAIGLGAVVAGLTAYGRQALTAGEDSQLLALRVKALAEPLGELARLQAFTARAAEQFTIGQNDAGQAVTDLYGRLRPMGVGLDRIETTFIGVSKAARLSGLGAFDAKEAFRQLGQAMGSGRLQGDELRSLMERMPAIGQAIVQVFNDISRSRGLQQITRQRADELVAEVRDGEKRQTEELQEGIRDRQRAMQKDTDDQLRLIARRYDALRTAMNQAEEDGDTKRDRATQDRLDVEKKAIDERYEIERDGIEERVKLRLKEVSGDTRLSDAQREAVEKRISDERDAILDGIQERQSEELKRLSRGYEDQANQSRRAREADRKEKEIALQDQQRAEEDQVRESLRRRQEDLQSAMNKELEIQKEANKKAIVDILLRTKITVGDLKKMGAEGLITTDIMLKAMDKLAQKSIPPPTALMEFNKAMKDLTKTIGDDLLPMLTPAIQGLTSLIKSFIAAPAWVKQLTVGLGLLVTVLGALALAIASAKFIGMTLGIVGLIDKLKTLITTARTASMAVKTVTVRDITSQALGGGAAKMLPPVGGVPPMQPPPPGLFKAFLGQIATVSRAMGGLIADVALFGVRLLGLIPGVGRLGAAFASLRIGATIAGWLGALVPFAGQAIAAMSPFLAWITGTLLPTLVGVFSGPAGWIALGVAALVAGVVLFREPIMKFFEWALGEVGKFWKNIFDFIYNTQVKSWVNLWTNVLQKPITQFIGWLWKVTEPVRNLFVNLGTIASEGIKFIFRLFNDILIKPLLSLAEWAFKGLIQLGYAVFVQPWISLWGVVKKPLADLWEWLATSAKVAFDALIQLGYVVFIEPWVKLWDAIKKPMADLWQWLGTTAQVALDALIKIGYDLFIKPWVELWDNIKKPISTLYGWIQSGIKKVFEEINKFGNEKFIKPWGELWGLITEEPDKFQKKVKGWFDTLYDGIIEKWNAIPALFQNIWYNVTNGMGRAWSWMINGVVGKLNEIIVLWNRVAEGVNKLPTQFKLPVIPEFVREQIPGFARGGWVSRPTIAQLGEGGDPGGEYAIPAGRMDAAMAAWMQGVRGPALVQAWQSSPSPAGPPAAAPLPGSYGAAPQVTLQLEQTGPTLQMSDGSQWIRRDEAMALLQSNTRATLAAVDQMSRSAVNRNRYGPR